MSKSRAERLREQLKALSMRHSMAIVAALSEGPKYITQIAEALGIPFATAHQRVKELEGAGLVEVAHAVDGASKRAVRAARLVNFRIELSPRIIRQLVAGAEEPDLRVA